MKVEAYECPHCQGIYKTKAKAESCKKACEKQKAYDANEKEKQPALKELVDYVRLNAESVEDICRLSEEVSQKMHGQYFIKKMRLSVRYAQHASNSHSAPIGKKSNWSGREKGLPTGYPALCGSISVVFNKGPKGFSSDVFNSHNGIAGINTGSGGYRGNEGGYTVGYDVTLWLDDFPKIKEKIEATLVSVEQFNALKVKLSEQLNNEVEADVEIQKINDEISVLESQINKLRTQVSNKIQNKDNIKKTLYLNQKEEFLSKEHEKLKNDFGIVVPSPKLSY